MDYQNILIGRVREFPISFSIAYQVLRQYEHGKFSKKHFYDMIRMVERLNYSEKNNQIDTRKSWERKEGQYGYKDPRPKLFDVVDKMPEDSQMSFEFLRHLVALSKLKFDISHMSKKDRGYDAIKDRFASPYINSIQIEPLSNYVFRVWCQLPEDQIKNLSERLDQFIGRNFPIYFEMIWKIKVHTNSFYRWTKEHPELPLFERDRIYNLSEFNQWAEFVVNKPGKAATQFKPRKAAL